MRVFDTSFDYKTDKSRKAKRGNAGGLPPDSPSVTQELGDPDSNSLRLRADHELLWTKKLNSGALFAPSASAARWNEYLIYTDESGTRHCYGSDAITSSYTTWMRPQSLVDAIAGLNDEQRARYLNPPYTIGSAMIWPVRKQDQPTMNQARGLRPAVADRMDLTLECIRRHYAGEPGSPLADVTNAYSDFFKLFDGFQEFVEFFHFQDLVTPDYDEVQFYLPFDNFERPGTPLTTEEFVTYREATLQFIVGRERRMLRWVLENTPFVSGTVTFRC